MTKVAYIEKYGYISNSKFKIAQEIVRDYGVRIEDVFKPSHELLFQNQITLMIILRVQLARNCKNNFKNGFYRMDTLKKNRGVYAVNYTGHIITYNGAKYSGDYGHCILDKSKKFDIEGEKLYLITGSYPIYSVTSCLEEDIARVKRTNPSYITEEPTVIEITAYNPTT